MCAARSAEHEAHEAPDRRVAGIRDDGGLARSAARVVWRGVEPLRVTPAEHLPTLADHLPTLADHLPTLADYLPTLADHLPTLADYLPTPADRF